MGAVSRLARRLPARLRRRAVVLKGPRGLAIDRAVLRWTGVSLVTLQYAVAGGQDYCPTLLLTTIGRRSGAPRTVALPWVRDGEELVVCGSAAGGPKDPDWVGNLRAQPQCTLRVARRLVPAQARVVTGPERDRVFALLTSVRPSVAAYQESAARCGREIPLVALRPSVARAGG